MAIEEKYVGSLDDPPPLGQTFAKIQTWDQLLAFVRELVQDNTATLNAWWDLARAMRRQVEVLDTVRGNFTRLLADLEHEFRGAAGRAVQARGSELVTYMRTVADALRESPTPIDQTGHDIVVYAKAFWDAKDVFDRLAHAEGEAFVEWLKSWYHNANRTWTGQLGDRAREAARQMVERNLHIPHQRRLLMILAAKYAGKHGRLDPFAIQIAGTRSNYTGSPGAGSGGDDPGFNSSPGPGSFFGVGPGSGTGNNSASGLVGRGAGFGPGAGSMAASARDQARRAAAKAANDAINRLKTSTPGAGFGTAGLGSGIGSGAGRLPTSSAGLDSPRPDSSLRGAIPGLGGGSGSAESAVPWSPGTSPGSSLGPSPGSGLGQTLPQSTDSAVPFGSNGAGRAALLSPLQRQALEDARRAALNEIEALKQPGDSAARTRALDDAKQAVSHAIDNLANTGLPGLTDQASTLRAARAAAAQGISDLLDNDPDPSGPGTRTDPAARERALALQQAWDAADRAINDMIERTPPTTSDLGAAVRSAALEDARVAVDRALEDLADSIDGVDAQEREVREDALADVRRAADDVIDDLRRQVPGAGSLGEIRDDALADVRRDLTHAFDELIEDTTENRGLPDADKAVRVDAIGDAKDAALRALDELSAQEQSDLARFLTGGAGSGGSTGIGGGSSGGGSSGVRTGPGVQLGIVPASPGGVGSQTPAPLFSPALDPAALANQGMPMAPPMGGAGMAGPHKERERSTWVDGDPDVWQDEDDEAVSAQAIGRPDAPSDR